MRTSNLKTDLTGGNNIGDYYQNRLLWCNGLGSMFFSIVVFLIFSDYIKLFQIQKDDVMFLIYFRPAFSALLGSLYLCLGLSQHYDNLCNSVNDVSSVNSVNIVVDGGLNISEINPSPKHSASCILNTLTSLPQIILTPSWYKLNSFTAHLTSYESFLLHPLLINGCYLVLLDTIVPIARDEEKLGWLYFGE